MPASRLEGDVDGSVLTMATSTPAGASEKSSKDVTDTQDLYGTVYPIP